MTLRELIISHDAVQVERWWHTSLIASQLYNLQTLVYNGLGGKKRMPPKSASDLHPFVNPKPTGIKVSKKNFSVLKALGNAMCRR